MAWIGAKRAYIRGGGGAAGIVDAGLLHAGHDIGAGPQHRGQSDGVATARQCAGDEIGGEVLAAAGEKGIQGRVALYRATVWRKFLPGEQICRIWLLFAAGRTIMCLQKSAAGSEEEPSMLRRMFALLLTAVFFMRSPRRVV